MAAKELEIEKSAKMEQIQRYITFLYLSKLSQCVVGTLSVEQRHLFDRIVNKYLLRLNRIWADGITIYLPGYSVCARKWEAQSFCTA